MVVVEGAIFAIFVAGPITMIIIGILLNVVGLGIFCRALFALATHALPFFVAVTVGICSFRAGAGAGPFGAIVVGFVTGGLTRQWPSPSHALPSSALSLGCYSRFQRHVPTMM